MHEGGSSRSLTAGRCGLETTGRFIAAADPLRRRRRPLVPQLRGRAASHSERTVRRLESVGRLRSLKLTPGRAGRVIFRREELLRFVSDAENDAEPMR